jgi:hypothetical protein
MNEAFGWLWIACGMATGAVIGLFFHRENWLGGYATFPRRLVRLGHIAFFGLGFINIFFQNSLPRAALTATEAHWASLAMIVGGVTMPLVCFLCAWRKPLRHLFVVPVASLLHGTITLAVGLFRSTIAG